MKTLKTRLTIAAAALAVVAGSASAQSSMLKAEIPFTFHTQNATLSPGSYLVTTTYATGRQFVVLRNADTGAAAILAQYVDAQSPWGASDQPRLMFECAGRACILREMWKGGGSGGFKFVGPKLPRGEDVRIAEVALTSTKTD